MLRAINALEMVKTSNALAAVEKREVIFSLIKLVVFKLRIKIKHTSQILKTESPAKIAHAILDGDDPPKLSFDAVCQRAKRLLKIKKDEGVWRLEDTPRSGRPVTVITNVH